MNNGNDKNRVIDLATPEMLCQCVDHSDRVMNTTTWFGQFPLSVIQKFIGIANCRPSWLDNIFMGDTDTVVMKHSHLWSVADAIYSIYRLRQCDYFDGYLTLTISPNGKPLLHPGLTRLMFQNIYHSPVNIMITNHASIPVTDIIGSAKVYKADPHRCSIPATGLQMRVVSTADNSELYLQENFMTKELHTGDASMYQLFHDPSCEFTLTYRDSIIYYDGHPLFVKRWGNWSII